MFCHFRAISRFGTVGRFVIPTVAMSLTLIGVGAEGAIVIDPSTFKIPESAFFTPGTIIGQTLVSRGNPGVFRAGRGRSASGAETAAYDGLQTAFSHGGSIRHFSNNSLPVSTPYFPTATGGNGRKNTPAAVHHGQLTGSSTVLSVGALPTLHNEHLPPPTVFPKPSEDLYSPPSLPDHLIPRGEQVDVSVGLVPIDLNVVAVPEPATAIIWVLGLAGTACVAGRRRNGRTIAHG